MRSNGLTVALGVSACLAAAGLSTKMLPRGHAQTQVGPREGSLAVGDEAPDFTLKTLDGSAEVTLASHRGECPVALIFGSYT